MPLLIYHIQIAHSLSRHPANMPNDPPSSVSKEYNVDANQWNVNYAWAIAELPFVEGYHHVDPGDSVLDLGSGTGDHIHRALACGAGFVVGVDASRHVASRLLHPWCQIPFATHTVGPNLPDLVYHSDPSYYIAIADMTDSQAIVAHLNHATALHSSRRLPGLEGTKFHRIFILHALHHLSVDLQRSWLEMLSTTFLQSGGTITITILDPEMETATLEVVSCSLRPLAGQHNNQPHNIKRHLMRWIGSDQSAERAFRLLRGLADHVGLGIRRAVALPNRAIGPYQDLTPRTQAWTEGQHVLDIEQKFHDLRYELGTESTGRKSEHRVWKVEPRIGGALIVLEKPLKPGESLNSLEVLDQNTGREHLSPETDGENKPFG